MVRPCVRPLPVLMLLAGCNRYEWRQAECPPRIEPAPHSAAAWQAVSGPPAIAGRVLAVEGGGAARALVAITRTDRSPGQQGENRVRSTMADDAGAFRFDSVAPGTYALTARSIGYIVAREAVRVPADSSAVVAAVLARDRIGFDECGYVKYRVRKPWWKW